MKSCSVCGHSNEDRVRFCVACGTRFGAPTDVEMVTELAHVEWAMHQIPAWRQRGLISPGTAGMLVRELEQRRAELSRLQAGAARGQPYAPEPSVGSQLPPIGSPREPSPDEARPAWLRRFVEEHWLQILAVVAGAFVVAGMRQFLGWEWISLITRYGVPLLPLVLSFLLVRYGLAARDRSTVASHSLCGVGAAISGFIVIAADRYWLGDALTAPWSLSLGCATATSVAAGLRRFTKDVFYEHLVLPGVGVTTFATIFAATPPHVLMLAELWRYATASAILGMCYMALGLRPDRRQSMPAQRLDPALVWSHVALACAGLAIVLRVLDNIFAGRPLSEDRWFEVVLPAVLCAAGYAAAAVLTNIPEVLYTSVGAVGLSGVILVERMASAMSVAHTYRLAADLVPVAAVLLAKAAAVRRWAVGQYQRAADRWEAPLLHGVALAGWIILVVVLGQHERAGITRSFWTTMCAIVAICSTGACMTVRRQEVLAGQVLAATGLAGLAILASLALRSLAPDVHGLPDLYTGTALLAFAWLTVTAGSLAKSGTAPVAEPEGTNVAERRSWTEVWSDPLLITGSSSGVFGMGFAIGAAFAEQQSSTAQHAVVVLSASAVAFAVSAASVVRPAVMPWSGSVVLAGAAWLVLATSPSRPPIGAWAFALGSAVCAAFYSAAAWHGTPYLGWASVLAGSAAWSALTGRILHVPGDWWLLAQVPFLAAVYVAGDRWRANREEELAQPARVMAAGLAVVWELRSLGEQVLLQKLAGWPTTAALLAVSLLVAIRTVYRPSALWAGITSAHALVTLGYHLAGARLPAESWAACMALASGALAVAGRLTRRIERCRCCTAPIYGTAACGAFLGLLAALTVVDRPGSGEVAILAIACAASVWAALFAFGAGAIYSHCAFGGYFIAYAIFLYDHVELNAGVLDLYLVPVGIYLLVLGHIAAKRGNADSASIMWWIGSVMILSPTYLAFYQHFQEGGTALHALLLVVECVAGVLWGIVHRIRAFVVSGTLFALAFAAVLGVSAITQVWIGLIALTTGMLLLVAVYWIGTRRRQAAEIIERAIREWERWR